MSDEEELNQHISNVGQVVVQLHSLEFVVRAAVTNLDKSGAHPPDLDTLVVGQWVEAGPMTSYDPLGPAIEKFNTLAPESKRLNREAIVGLRDMLAHGRVFSDVASPPFRLLKFGKEKGGRVPVEAVIIMTDGWFREQLGLLESAATTAMEFCR